LPRHARDKHIGLESSSNKIEIGCIYSQRLWVMAMAIEHGVMLMRIAIMKLSPVRTQRRGLPAAGAAGAASPNAAAGAAGAGAGAAAASLRVIFVTASLPLSRKT
jgi:hypothetical protein